jgi:hypothetical protein
MYICDNWYVLYDLVDSRLRRTTRTKCHICLSLPHGDGLLASPKHVEK